MTQPVVEPRPAGAPAPAPSPTAAPDGRSDPTPLDRTDAVWAALLGLGALLVRLPRLGRPRALVFDEVYYAADARDLLRWGAEQVAPAHPPLGKWLIAGGIEAFGFTPVGWRSAAVLAGSLLVVVVYLGGRQLTDDRRLAGAGAVLVALDGLVLVMSRVAMLDIFLTLFVAASVALLLAAWARPGDHELSCRLRWAVACCLGLGAGVKWSALLVLPIALTVFLTLDRRLAVPGRPRRLALARTTLVLLVVPALVYVATYTVWFARYDEAASSWQRCGEPVCPTSVAGRAPAWLDTQRDMARFHLTHPTHNSRAAPAWTWPLLARPSPLLEKDCVGELGAAPAALDDGVCPDGARAGPSGRARLLAVANPVGWFAGVAAVAVLLVRAARRSDPVAPVLVGLTALQWLPWVMTGKNVYSFYAVTLVPLFAWSVVATLRSWRRGRPVALGLVVAQAVAFAWFLPIWTGAALSPGDAGYHLLPWW